MSRCALVENPKGERLAEAAHPRPGLALRHHRTLRYPFISSPESLQFKIDCRKILRYHVKKFPTLLSGDGSYASEDVACSNLRNRAIASIFDHSPRTINIS